jgi:putative transferase (TIGR04331 family)
MMNKNDKNKRFLVTTSDERSWEPDQPTLFLGEWCRLYERKQVWERMDAVVAEPYGLLPEQKEVNTAYIQRMSAQLLIELTDALNAFHGVQHSLRYWELLLGHWLRRFVTISFDRYFTLKDALDKYGSSGTTIFDSSSYSLATTDSLAFLWACNDDVWNHVFYSRIFNYLKGGPVTNNLEALEGCVGFRLPMGSAKFQFKGYAKMLARSLTEKILPSLSRKGDAFFIQTYLPRVVELKLQISLGQFPQIWRSPRLNSVEPNRERLRSFKLNTQNLEGFDSFVRSILCETIPSCYLEGYSPLMAQVAGLPWPSRPQFVFTSNSFDFDEVFKAWVGAKVEQGVTYFAGQHGANYGTHARLCDLHMPEHTVPDKFITWGWSNEDPKIIPAFVFTQPCKTKKQIKKAGGLLLVELQPPIHLGLCDTLQYPEFIDYQEEQFRFVEQLPASIQQQLTVRLYRGFNNLSWCDKERWHDRSPATRIDDAEINIAKSISSSRLIVFSYDSTGLLENLCQNVPSLCFWQGGLDHLRESAKPYYEKLQQAGILLNSAESAAQKVASVWDDVPAWWSSECVQNARKFFCDRYARVSSRPVEELKEIFVSHA